MIVCVCVCACVREGTVSPPSELTRAKPRSDCIPVVGVCFGRKQKTFEKVDKNTLPHSRGTFSLALPTHPPAPQHLPRPATTPAAARRVAPRADPPHLSFDGWQADTQLSHISPNERTNVCRIEPVRFLRRCRRQSTSRAWASESRSRTRVLASSPSMGRPPLRAGHGVACGSTTPT